MVGSSVTAGRVVVFLLPEEPKMRATTPVGCCSVTGVDTGVAGTDLLPPTDDSVAPATAVDILLAVVAVEPAVVNCRPGIGRAGGARKTHSNWHHLVLNDRILRVGIGDLGSLCHTDICWATAVYHSPSKYPLYFCCSYAVSETITLISVAIVSAHNNIF